MTCPTVRVKLVGLTLSEGAAAVYTPEQVYAVLEDVLADAPAEELWVLYLNAQNGIIGRQMVARGALNGLNALPREVFTGAMLAGALSIVLAHNHPSGSLKPSVEDVAFTQRMVAAGTLLGIQVLDHVIVTRSGHASLRALGKM